MSTPSHLAELQPVTASPFAASGEDLDSTGRIERVISKILTVCPALLSSALTTDLWGPSRCPRLTERPEPRGPTNLLAEMPGTWGPTRVSSSARNQLPVRGTGELPSSLYEEKLHARRRERYAGPDRTVSAAGRAGETSAGTSSLSPVPGQPTPATRWGTNRFMGSASKAPTGRAKTWVSVCAGNGGTAERRADSQVRVSGCSGCPGDAQGTLPSFMGATPLGT